MVADEGLVVGVDLIQTCVPVLPVIVKVKTGIDDSHGIG
jgi:hypothetical protein